MLLADDPISRRLDADDYINFVSRCIDERRPIPAPGTFAQLKALTETFPDHARACLPSRDECRRLGLYVDPPQPFGAEFRRRFIATLHDDQEFREAVGAWIAGAQ